MRAVGIVVAAAALATGGGSFLTALGLGLWLLPGASPLANLLVWDALVGAYVVVRLSGLLANTQRMDAVPLARLLHLPISPRGVFALNFVIAETTFASVVFVPALLGLAIASTVAVDVAFAVLVPGALALGLCVVAVAYQFRTWLASTMARGRRRIPVGIVLLFSAIVAMNGFNLFLQYEVREGHAQREANTQLSPEQTRQYAVQQRERLRGFEENARLANVLLPPGWIPLAAERAAQGVAWPGILAMSGLSLLGGLSLRRSYRSTLDIYRQREVAPGHAVRRRGRDRRRRRVGDAPRGGPPAMAVARMAWRVWMRSARGKVLLFFSPLFMGMLPGFAAIGFPGLLTADNGVLTAVALLGIASFAAVTLACNVFGVDGGGFRLLVVAPVSRRAVLAGKYLACLPMFALPGAAVLVCIQVVAPLEPWHLIGVCLQGSVLFAVCSIVGGELSMRAPYAVSADSFYSPKSDAAGFLGMFAMLVAAAPVVAVAAGALAVERWIGGPAFALLSAAEVAGALWTWRWVLSRQARRLNARAARIDRRVAGER